MAHIYRAFFAPMVRMNTSAGVPTTVPFLFNNILRRILKDYQPDYVCIVFDTSKPTFRDKLFQEYKAHRPKMPDELSIQLPFVRRLCEAMRLPILEWDGFEADDVLGALAKQATKANVDVMLVTNDKDMLQLVGDGAAVVLALDQEDLVFGQWAGLAFLDERGGEPDQTDDGADQHEGKESAQAGEARSARTPFWG